MNKKVYRSIFLGVILCLIVSMTVILSKIESSTCLGIRILPSSQLEKYTQYKYIDLSDKLMFKDEPVAIDIASSTVYIPQHITEGSKYNHLVGKLKCSDLTYSLYFEEDEGFSDLVNSVKEGHSFRLLATDETEKYAEFKVVFTTLPVIRVNGSFSHVREDDGRNEFAGDVCLWAPDNSGMYSVNDGNVLWHVRGGSTLAFDKKSWKLSLKDGKWNSKDVDFLGLGADDDWILNPMSLDDIKVREKLFMELWNRLSQESPWNKKMSAGEYVEAVINGEYYGLYLLQRRVDEKYLQLMDSEILIKGTNTDSEATIFSDNYEIISSPLNTEQTFSLIESFHHNSDVSMVQKDNFIDINLFLMLASAADNLSYKNMFYFLKENDDGYSLSMVPWDTDSSFGICWKNNFFAYDLEKSLSAITLRKEYLAMQILHPEIDKEFALRWKSLRQNIFDTDYVKSLANEYRTLVTESGAFNRDYDKWGSFFDGADTVDGFYKFIDERLLRLDNLYSKID